MNTVSSSSVNRRDLLTMIGKIAGTSVMYNAMTSLGFAKNSRYSGRIKLEGNAKGASVLILGAGLAGMTAALELRSAGYKVQVIEYNGRAGGRNWTLRGGDEYIELGGAVQTCQFDSGLYFNPGPWRIPYHHRALLDYCRRFRVELEPFIQINHNAYVHSSGYFSGKPQRYREIMTDFNGQIAELLAKATAQGKLDQMVTVEDKEILLAALKDWGALDKSYSYRESLSVSDRRGFDNPPGGGLNSAPVLSKPITLDYILKSGLWQTLTNGVDYEWQSTMFQPVGGMDMIGRAFEKEVGDLIQYHSKVTHIHQDAYGVSVAYADNRAGGAPRKVRADWCVCTIPLSILGQIDMNVSTSMANAINAVHYASSVKTGLQFKRRFWEEDEAIYGGISYTDLPIAQISYPSSSYGHFGKGILVGSYTIGANGFGFNPTGSFEFTAMSPDERVRKVVDYGAQIHPQYRKEFENGVSVAWHRVPFALGCAGVWTEETRARHYKALCAIDGRIVLAGEHASELPAWQEGAILSALDAITRLHQRVLEN